MKPDTEYPSTAVADGAVIGEERGGDAALNSSQQAGDQRPADPADKDATIARLAQLDRIDYDRVRKQEADALGIRPATLDQSVQAARKTLKSTADGLPHWQVQPWPEPIDPATLLMDIAAAIGRFVVCSRESAHAAALWAAMTWFMDVVQIAPIALITAPEKRCGKTVLLTVISSLARRPLATSSTSPAALYRVVDQWQPTMLIDEADTFMKDNEALRGILNAGHTRETAWVLRCSGDEHEPSMFNTWGAKAIAGIGRLPDTIMDRAITLKLRRKLPGERTEKQRRASSMFHPLVRKLARFAEDYQQAVAQCRPSLLEGLHDRAQDNWEPLMSIAQVAGGPWPAFARKAALALTDSDTPSEGTSLLADIRKIFVQCGRDRISTEDLLAALCADEEGPWAAYRQGRPMTAGQLAKQLSEYGINSQTIRLTHGTAKGYLLRRFEDAFVRYVADTASVGVTPSQASNHAGSRVTETSKSDLEESTAVTPEALQHKGCDGVTDKEGKEGQLAEVYV